MKFNDMIADLSSHKLQSKEMLRVGKACCQRLQEGFVVLTLGLMASLQPFEGKPKC